MDFRDLDAVADGPWFTETRILLLGLLGTSLNGIFSIQTGVTCPWSTNLHLGAGE
ncbi:hypothetical protein HanHA300_Chr16g0601081 [Helianthus annuus]|nr:hypothetical protein HanHA300_Chr16g0601081 [Helianthus annuus]KAJ0459666.1 hypothetical protein HanHA89_Chr16g0651581 [Helianthus annuus]KAJ0640147.1 hypothetical protein HanLR1_Chr16g0611931 [Helianthus annuus]KAJ0644103.1 hypothetical protein HanOQP8_Chr16g0608141 [Helianthus annuus]